MKYLIILFILLFCSCGPSINESWVLNPDGDCNKAEMSYGRMALYHFNNQNDCQYIYDMNDVGFLVDKYFECDYGTYGVWRFFRYEDECLNF